MGRSRNLAAGLAAAMVLMSGVAVAQTPDPTGTPGSSASPAATAANAAANAELGDIEWAREIDPVTNAPVRRATGFVTTDPAIHAVIPVIRILQGTVVSATWSFDGEAVPALDTSVTAASSYENGWLAFSLTRPEAEIWPIGTYGIAIYVDGVEMLTSNVEVQVPPA
jgi:type II secretory pathway component PulK